MDVSGHSSEVSPLIPIYQSLSLEYMNKLDFLEQWFGREKRSLGIPYQTLVGSPLRVYHHMAQWSYPVFLSVNPYTPEGKIAYIEKLYFDFDSPDPSLAWIDCLAFTNKIRAMWGIDDLIIRSGHKGFNAYVWLTTPYSGDDPGSATQEELKEKYTALQNQLIGCDPYPTLDRHVIGDIRRIARVPYSLHQVTGNLVVPVNIDGEPYDLPSDFIVHHKLYGINPFGYFYTPQKIPSRITRPLATHNQTKTTELRPCMQSIVESASVHDPAHKLKVCLVAELYEKGYSENAIVAFFSGMSGFNEAITRSQIRSVIGNYKPFRCSTIRALGGCVGASCRFYRLESVEHSSQFKNI